jgi:hypothetical protein
MKARYSVLFVVTMALLLGGAVSAFAVGPQGHTPAFASDSYQGTPMSSAQPDASTLSKLESANVDSLLSPSELVALANTFVGEKLGTGVAPAQVYF